MRGSIRRRTKDSWELTVDMGRSPEGKRLRKFIHVKGTKKEAEAKLREFITAAERGIDISPSKITLGEWMDRWMAEHIERNGRQKTKERYRGIIERHIRPRIGHVLLVKLLPTHIRELQNELLGEGMAAAGVELVHTVLSGAMKHALRLDLVWRNPCAGAPAPRRPHKEVVPPDVKAVVEVLRRAKAEEHPLYPAMHLVSYTGLRRGEALGLGWADLDLDRAVITVNRGLVRSLDLGVMIQPVKTDKSRRRIDLDTDTVEVLRRHKVRQLEHRLRLGQAYQDKGLVFPDALGNPINPMKLTRAFQAVAEAAGLGKPKLHSLRHFHASMLFAQGESPVLVQQRLGHASITTTANVYGHLFPGQQRQAAQTFAQAMRGGQ